MIAFENIHENVRHVDAVLLRISTTVARFFPPPVRVTEIYLTLSLACCYTPISANTKTKHHVISHFSRFFLLTLGLIKIFLEKKKRKERWSFHFFAVWLFRHTLLSPLLLFSFFQFMEAWPIFSLAQRRPSKPYHDRRESWSEKILPRDRWKRSTDREED